MSETSIVDVAYYILSKKPITNKKLQVILYYVQGWHMGMYHKPLFKEDFRAWTSAPTCTELYSQLKEYGEIIYTTESMIQDLELTIEQINFIDSILKDYSYFEQEELENFSRKESPWIETRGDIGRYDRCNNIISKELIEKYFSERVNKS